MLMLLIKRKKEKNEDHTVSAVIGWWLSRKTDICIRNKNICMCQFEFFARAPHHTACWHSIIILLSKSNTNYYHQLWYIGWYHHHTIPS